jgi:hypothetical protein
MFPRKDTVISCNIQGKQLNKSRYLVADVSEYRLKKIIEG